MQFGARRRLPREVLLPLDISDLLLPRLLQLQRWQLTALLMQRRQHAQPPSLCWVSRFCRTAGSRLCTPEGLIGRGPNCLCPVFSSWAAHQWETTILILAILLEWCSFLFPSNSPAQVGTTPSPRPTPLSLSSVTKKNICTRLLMTRGPQISHHQRAESCWPKRSGTWRTWPA